MGVYDTSHTIRPFTRKIYRKTPGPSIRKQGNRPKGIYHTIRRNTVAPVKLNTRVVKTVLNKNETRRHRKAKRKAREWNAIVEQINDPEIRENIGLYIDENGNLVSTEGEVFPGQYDLLIEELENRLYPNNNDEYEQKIINKAIRFVRKMRAAHVHAGEMNSLEAMMSGLSTGR